MSEAYKRHLRAMKQEPDLSMIEKDIPESAQKIIRKAEEVAETVFLVLGILIVAAAVGGAMGGFSGLGSA